MSIIFRSIDPGSRFRHLDNADRRLALGMTAYVVLPVDGRPS